MRQIGVVVLSVVMVAGLASVAADADVNINIGVALPPLAFAAPPDVVVVPSGSTYVYMVPDMMGLYFYHGHWYRIHDGRWYRAASYKGPWGYWETSRVPRVIVDVPPDYYRRLPPGYHRVPHGELHRNWRSWDKNRHWHGHDWYKHGHEGWRRDHHDSRGAKHHAKHDVNHDGTHGGKGAKPDGRHEGKAHANHNGHPGGNDDGIGGKQHERGSGHKEGSRTHPDDRRGMGGPR